MNFISIFIARYLYIFSIAAAVVFFVAKTREIKKRLAVCFVAIASLSYIISRIASRFYYDPRPFVAGHFTPLIAHAPDNGFPSDHVLLAGAVAMAVYFYNKKLGAALWAIAAVIGIARIYAGIHHFADVFGGAAIVVLSAAIYYYVVHKFKFL